MTILSDRTAVVTGATSGIGFFVAAGLAIRGATVLVTGRDKNRGWAAVNELRRRSIHNRVEFMQVDHSIVRANAQLAAAVERRFDRLDLLVNNAGGIYSTRWETEDGYEATLAMNFIGPATVTMQLLPLLKKSRGRCVNVVSSALATSKSDPFADLQSEERYVAIHAYARAKLLNALWARGLAIREPGVDVYAVNPGMAWTPSTQQLTPDAVPAWRLIWPLVRWFQRRASAETAGRIVVDVATSPPGEIPSGSYVDEKMRVARLPKTAYDVSVTDHVWVLAAALATGAASTNERGGRTA